MVKFLEGNGDFINFDGDEEDDSGMCSCTCNECGVSFEVEEDTEPDQCPSCGTDFDFGDEE